MPADNMAQLLGDKALILALKEMTDKGANDTLKPGTRSSASLVSKAAKKNIKHHTVGRIPTGQLKRSIGHRVIKSKKHSGLVGIIGPRKGFAVKVGKYNHDPSFIGHLVERGHVKGDGIVGPAPAYPFLAPALESTRGAVKTTMTTKARATLPKVVAKIRAKAAAKAGRR